MASCAHPESLGAQDQSPIGLTVPLGCFGRGTHLICLMHTSGFTARFHSSLEYAIQFFHQFPFQQLQGRYFVVGKSIKDKPLIFANILINLAGFVG